jgi:putative hydrolase of the HAD superfamily
MLDISVVRAISLDLDDTLWPVWPTIARAELALQGWLAPLAPAAAALVADSKSRAALRQQVMDARPDLHHDLSHQRQELIRLALHQCGEDTAHAPEAFEVFFAERHRVDFYDDALPALAQLAARYPVLAVSNGNADVARVGVGHLFAGSVSARDAGVAKPDGRIFAAAASRLGLAPAQVLQWATMPHLMCWALLGPACRRCGSIVSARLGSMRRSLMPPSPTWVNCVICWRAQPL